MRSSNPASAIFFGQTQFHKPDREQQELTRGVWIYELAELAGMRKGDLHRIKAFITREEERAREAYARLHSRQARISIFYGTFNTDAVTGRLVEYLNQGDWRRWWGIPVGKILLDLLARDRWQLLAEAKEKAQPKPELGITEWASLQLAEKFWKEAGIIAAQREVADPLVYYLFLAIRRIDRSDGESSVCERSSPDPRRRL